MTEQQTETAPPPIVFVDTETTGVGPDRVPWEIAVIRRAPDGTETEHQWFLPLDDVSRVDGFALQVGRFWDRHPLGRAATGQWDLRADGPLDDAVGDPEVVSVELMQLTYRAIWVGANPAFDAELVDRLLRRHRMQPTWNYHLVDTGTMMLGYLHAVAGPGPDPTGIRPPVRYRSDDLAKLLGVEPADVADRHTALGDARWCQRIYDRVTGRAAAVAS